MTEALQWYYDARQAFIDHDYQRAVKLLQSSLRAADHFKSHEMLGQCYERLEDRSRAVEEYRRALELNPRSNKTACLLATTLVDQGELAAARVIVVSLLDRSPSYGPARRLLPRTEQ
ncbi:MAG: tetratricopeptide repeat protein [Planctomycetia bacterium]|nr:tetratricopeptide repeat protein [Planctomycetia bacterium]